MYKRLLKELILTKMREECLQEILVADMRLSKQKEHVLFYGDMCLEGDETPHTFCGCVEEGEIKIITEDDDIWSEQ